MARLPQPGSDKGNWGGILNEFLSESHNADGSLKDGVISTNIVANGAVTEAKLSSAVQIKLNNAASGNVGDDTISTAKLQNGAVTEPKIGTLSISKITNLQTTLDSKQAIGAYATSNDLTAGLSTKADASATATALNAKAPLASPAFTGTPTGITKAHVGLGSVDNTNDASKPISSATQTALNLKANTTDLSTVATTGSYTDLTNRPTIPTVTGTNTGDQSLSVSGTNLTISGGNTVVLPTGGSGSASWGAISGTVSDQADLQAALNGKQASGSYATTANLTSGLATKLDASQKAAASGVASLDSDTRVPSAQLGSGTANNTTYLRGDGAWTALATSTVTAANITDATTTGRNVLTATDATAARTAIGAGTSNLTLGSTGTTAATGNHTHVKTDVGLGNVDNTADVDKPISTATKSYVDTAVGGVTVNYSNLPAWTTLTITKTSGTWPARPTARNDIIVQWRGPDPSPNIVSSGTGGMLDNVDIRLVTS